jgi:TPR repeat protein
VELDKFEAVKWMTKAVNNNHKLAQFRLGGYYETAFGVKRDLAESLRWRTSSAYLGCKQAQTWLANLYWHISLGNSSFPAENITRDPPANLREAYAWFRAAADAPMVKRMYSDIPVPEELEGGKQPMSQADYVAERTKYDLAPGQRDSVATSFASAEEMTLAKERVVVLEAKITSECSLRQQK